MKTHALFLQRLSTTMAKLNLNQGSLARQLRTSPATVSRWFNGSMPRGRMLEDLGAALKVDPRWLTSADATAKQPENNTGMILREEPPESFLANDYAQWDEMRRQKIAALMGKLNYIFVHAAKTDARRDEESRRYAEFEIREFYDTLEGLRNSRPKENED